MNSKLFNIPIPLSINYLRRRSKVNPIIINYHVVSDEILPHIKHIYKFRSKQAFIDDLAILTRHFKVIDLNTFLDSLKNKVKLPENALLLTIDDGLKEIYTNMAPILLEKKIPATIFLTKNYVDNIELGYDHKKSLLIEKLESLKTDDVNELLNKYKIERHAAGSLHHRIINISYKNRNLVDQLANEVSIDFDKYLKDQQPYITSSQVKELINSGFSFGGHSIDHAPFIELDFNDQINQVVESVDFVCNSFDISYRVFAFPYWDAGISTGFFNRLTGNMDATFGTQGLLKDSSVLNHQRIGFERFPQSVKRILKVHYARKWIYGLLNRDIIKRPH